MKSELFTLKGNIPHAISYNNKTHNKPKPYGYIIYINMCSDGMRMQPVVVRF